MTDKQKFLNFIQESCDQGYEYFTVLISTVGADGLELIINPSCNLKFKLDYYDRAYDDNLVLKSFNGIKIVGYDACHDGCEIDSLFISDEEE